MDQKLNEACLLVCGPPASGKDTLTDWLSKIDNRFWHFPKHRGIDEKIPTNQASYHYVNISKQEFETLIKQDEFIQYHQRYHRYYGISRHILEESIQNGRIPVIHVGRINNLYKLNSKMNSKVIKLFLWAPLSVLEERLNKRHPGNRPEIERRLQAATEEFKDLLHIDLEETFDIIFKNDQALDKSKNRLISLLQELQGNRKEARELESYINQFD